MTPEAALARLLESRDDSCSTDEWDREIAEAGAVLRRALAEQDVTRDECVMAVHLRALDDRFAAEVNGRPIYISNEGGNYYIYRKED